MPNHVTKEEQATCPRTTSPRLPAICVVVAENEAEALKQAVPLLLDWLAKGHPFDVRELRPATPEEIASWEAGIDLWACRHFGSQGQG